ncbi:hypothetical protein BU24DRAFT_425404 [Aaosphaeria arxii CBS 175.79]|uniref:Uncharacterized protein n=1 Tax=Aaosphaeria arxii CBS 175.79 TaxID=1450172 RepID=A0A6A5XJ46_9PLEO|nr:uncharacterized protein BU24DRAFT_425404 [Aaosphaeria arxii CBS 175.79]KAF2012780.1 hypothetical protein BU24DRAFT_425404 [Aaosphaeria arxii CBS 175.79]
MIFLNSQSVLFLSLYFFHFPCSYWSLVPSMLLCGCSARQGKKPDTIPRTLNDPARHVAPIIVINPIPIAPCEGNYRVVKLHLIHRF